MSGSVRSNKSIPRSPIKNGGVFSPSISTKETSDELDRTGDTVITHSGQSVDVVNGQTNGGFFLSQGDSAMKGHAMGDNHRQLPPLGKNIYSPKEVEI